MRMKYRDIPHEEFVDEITFGLYARGGGCVPLVKISAVLGHSSIHTTFEFYCDVLDEKEKIKDYINDTFSVEEMEEDDES